MTLRGRFLVAMAVVVAILGVANLVTYVSMRSRLLDRLDAQLRSAGTALTEAATPLLGAAAQGTPDLRRLAAVAPLGALVEVREADGSVLATIGRSTALETDPALPAAGSTVERTIDGDRWRVEAFAIGGPPAPAGKGAAAAAAAASGVLFVALPLAPIDSTLRNLLGIEVGASLAVLLALAAVAFWLWRLGLRPIERIAQAAGAIAAGDLDQRIPDGDAHSEVGRLSSALNAMLDEVRTSMGNLRASEDRLRRFVSDASHELRTPLTAIRGYADLYRDGDLPRDADVRLAMQRIDESSDRMSALVDELLLLARLDQGRPLERERLDLTALAGDALIDAAAIEPLRPIDFDGPTAVFVDGDRHRLEQVVVNLLANVRVHTTVDTPVWVSVRAEDGVALLAVRDAGPGIAPAAAERIFDRFFRASDARTRQDGGNGLGLSIVDAVVRAHGGEVVVRTAVGVGATFTVRLPLATDQVAPARAGEVLREGRAALQAGSRLDPQS